jgi:hydroxymethylglutaryl-CoA lyase
MSNVEPLDVVVADVCARDGLQTLTGPRATAYSTAEKAALISALDEAGVPEIEITGFSHPRVVPSLADAEDVARTALGRPHRAVYRALVPNLRGAERAAASGMTKLSCLIVASETYQRLNSNMSVEENLAEIERIVQFVSNRNIRLMVGLGIAFICPYEGVIAEAALMRILERLVAAGLSEITLADSVGMAWPGLVRERVTSITSRWPGVVWGLHLHDLVGLALANALAAYELGITHFDGAVGGIGGGIAMPVESAQLSNVATEDLVYLFSNSGISTGIDAARLRDIAMRVRQQLNAGSGHVSAFGTLEEFVRSSKSRLASKENRRPGDSHGLP